MPFSLVIACYNESEHLYGSVKALVEILDKSFAKYELIFIDDKSRDNTATILSKIKKRYNNRDFHFYFHTENLGRGATVSEGILKAKYNTVGFIDIDLEVSPKYIPTFVK